MVIEHMGGLLLLLIGTFFFVWVDDCREALRCIDAYRSEVVGRPLAALLANDGARVLSVDIDSIQVSVKIILAEP